MQKSSKYTLFLDNMQKYATNAKSYAKIYKAFHFSNVLLPRKFYPKLCKKNRFLWVYAKFPSLLM